MNNKKFKTIGVSEKYHKAIKIEAVIRDCPMQDVVEEAIELWMDHKDKKFSPEENRVRINPENLTYQGQEDLTHTKIENATFGEVTRIQNWKNLVEEGIKQAISAGKKDAVIDIIPNAQIGVTGDNPNRYVVEGTDISIIPMDSNSCCFYAFKLAQVLNRKLRVEFYWRKKKEALHPGKKGFVEWLPEGRK